MEGVLYSWGYNGIGLAAQGVDDEICIPRKINLLNVQKIGTGYFEIYFLTNERSIYFSNKKQNTPKKIDETKHDFTYLESNYCCDSKNMFYEMKTFGKLEVIDKFESFSDFNTKFRGLTGKMVHILHEYGNSNRTKQTN